MGDGEGDGDDHGGHRERERILLRRIRLIRILLYSLIFSETVLNSLIFSYFSEILLLPQQAFSYGMNRVLPMKRE